MVPGSATRDAPPVGFGDWDTARDGRAHPPSGAGDDTRPAQPEHLGSIRGHGAADGPLPETGRWSVRQGRWIPQQCPPDDDGFGIGRYEETGDITGGRPEHGQVLEHDDWYEVNEPTVDRRTGTYRSSMAAGSAGPAALTRSSTSGHAAAPVDEWFDGAEHGRRSSLERQPSGEVDDSVRRDRSAGGLGRAATDADPVADLAEPPEPPGPPAAGAVATALATIAWYAVPLLIYVGWLLLDGSPAAGCVDASGAACAPSRLDALRPLVGSLPSVGLAVVVSLLVASVLRLIATGWRCVAIGFAAAVVGAGLLSLFTSG